MTPKHQFKKHGKYKYECACGNAYAHQSGLSRHKKTCALEQSFSEVDSDKDLVLMLVKQNAELVEIVKNGTHHTNSHNTIMNSHNKSFNLNFFLNETCKNAMNITEFMESIQLQLSDFMKVGEVGFVKGISDIIVQNLNSLDETVRPIHCTDKKRETFYVKDEDMWSKEDEDRKKLKKLVKNVAFKNEKLMKQYKEAYPDYNDPESRRSDQYSKTVIEAMDDDDEKRVKIIRAISRATAIRRQQQLEPSSH